jgi:exportin-1
VLKRLSEDPNAWQKAPEVVEAATNDSSRFFALKLLEDCIKTRWNALPPDQRLAVKEYVVQRILQLSKDDASMSAHRVVVGKLNQLLVEILKHEWPHNWPTFITELTGSSKASQTMCENNMQILKLMSEEIFEFAEEAMTSKKTATLKESMHGEFAKVFELCTFILQNAKKDSLIDVTLQCLQRFICWVARGFIFETKLIEVLIQKFLPSGSTSIGVNTIGCLIEIVTLDNVAPAYHARVQLLFGSFMQKLVELLPPSTDMPSAYARGSTIQQFFVQKVGLFLTSTFKRHLALLEGPLREQVLVGMNYLVSISMVAEMEIFKDCIEFWNIFSWNLKQESDASLGMVGAVGGGGFGGGAAGAAAPFGAAPATDAWGKLTTGLAAQSRPVPASKGAASRNPRVQMYNARVLAAVRMVMVTKMARPEEVLIEEDDSGMIVRTTQRDTDAIELYKVMRETIVFLTHLDVENMEFIMMDKLSKQVNGAEWSWKGLNRLCWAIGSISQTMPEDDEKRFLVMVIKDLLQLCEAKHGKYNKAVVASCIMYVTSQYPRFLKAHWKFLKTVVNKLFEFMHELHPGVQDMACDTFIKISKKCKSKFLHLQELEDMPFVDRLLIDLPTTIRDLKAHQVQTFYEAVGHMISAEKSHPARRNDLLLRLMHLPHTEWERAMANASQSLMSLCEPETVKTITRTVRTMVQVCRAVGHPFIDYLQRVYGNMMQVYKVYSEVRADPTIFFFFTTLNVISRTLPVFSSPLRLRPPCLSQFVSTRFAEMGPIAAQADPLVRVIRQAKKECLLLIEAFIEKSDPAQMDEEGHPIVAHHLIPPLLEPSSVLGDYHRSHPGARDAEVLSLMSTFISKLRGQVGPLIPRVVEGVFEQTLGMIQQNFTDYPEIRRELFRLIAQITKHCFEQIFEIAAHHQRAVVECIMWAIKHHERSVSEMVRPAACPPSSLSLFLTLHRPSFSLSLSLPGSGHAVRISEKGGRGPSAEGGVLHDVLCEHRAGHSRRADGPDAQIGL